jgi:hypothetical protein
MKTVLGGALRRLVLGSLLVPGALAAQAQQGDPKKEKAPKEKKPYAPPPVFQAQTPLEFTLYSEYSKLKKDRYDQVPYHPATLVYQGDSGEVRVPLKIRARGIWRRKNCEIPPVRLNFQKDSTKKTQFAKIDQIRLMLPCKGGDDYQQYILQEYQLYRVQKLVMPWTLQARLAHVTQIDVDKKDTVRNAMGFLLEEDEDLADRLGAKIEKIKGATGDDLNGFDTAMFGVWQYFVGNTDFSVAALHNVVLFFKDSSYIPIAHDYDWGGAVSTKYARPAPQLNIRSVDQRLMRGPCTTPENFEKVFAIFREKKDSIYALYSDPLAAGMKPDVVKKTLKFFDEFYTTINNQRLAKRFIIEECIGGSA